MIFIFVGVFIGVFIEQTYSLPNIKEKITKCSKRSYGEDTSKEEQTENEPTENEPTENKPTEPTENESTESAEPTEGAENHID
jgi:hypothetical protein